MKESKSILYQRTNLCTASRNLAYTKNLYAYICTLCTRHDALQADLEHVFRVGLPQKMVDGVMFRFYPVILTPTSVETLFLC